MAGFGIDFGTTTSGVVQLLAGHPQKDGDGVGGPLPSIVVIDRATGEAFGGRAAWNKRFELDQHGNYFVIPDIKSRLTSDQQWPTSTRMWTPVDVAAFLFTELNNQVVRRGIPEGISTATVAIPVGLAAAARRTLRAAAAQVGIKIESFVSESTAAFFRYFSEYRHLRRVVVFDWGGGTLDVSVLESRSTGLYELALGGTPKAGNALDLDIALFLHRRIMESRGSRLGFDEMAPQDQTQLLFRAEQAKQRLRDDTNASVSLMSYGGAPVTMNVTREDLVPIVRPSVMDAIELLASTIHRAGLDVDSVDAILLVGGSSQLWLLPEELAKDPRFQGRYRRAESPEWDVAHGAALLSREPGAYTLAETLALRLSDGSAIELVRPGEQPVGEPRALSLVLTEDSPEAHLVIERRASGAPQPRPALHFSTPTLGFLEEEIALSYRLTQDLTFAVSASSRRRPITVAHEREIEDLRFGYEMKAIGQ